MPVADYPVYGSEAHTRNFRNLTRSNPRVSERFLELVDDLCGFHISRSIRLATTLIRGHPVAEPLVPVQAAVPVSVAVELSSACSVAGS
jgi:hypothetical protein